MGRNVNYYTFSNGAQLSYQTEGIFPDKTTKTANVYLVYTYTEKPSLPEGDLYISDSVSSDGLFTATFKDNVTIPKDATVVYQWERSLDKSIWTDVDRIAVSGSEGNYIYNMTEDGVSVNVVQDASPNAANVQDNQRYWYRVTATVTTSGGESSTYEAEPVQVPYYIELQNGSFESPVGHKQYTMGAEGLIWKTTGPGSLSSRPGDDIEIIRPSENDQTVQNYGVPVASEGEQFAELNCEAVGTLYQDVMTIPGTTLNWQFDHVARQRRGQNDTWDAPDLWDEMAMVIMPAEDADYWAYQLKQAGSDAATIRGVLAQIKTEVAGAYVLDNVRDQPYYKTNNDSSASWNVRGWGHYDSEDNGEPYKVPEGQYLTRFFFVSVSSGMGVISLGNCLDNVYFSKDPLPLENTKSRVIVTKNVTGVDAIPQDYSVTFHIGDKEQTLSANDFTQQGQTFTATATFTYTELSPNSSQTLTVVETGGTIRNYKQEISYRVTGGETTLTGTTAKTKEFDLPAGESRSVTFTNTYTPKTTDLTITKTFVGLDEEKANQVWDALGFTVASNGSTLTPAINKANDVTASANTFTATATIEGLTIGETYTVTETNADLAGYTRTTTVSGTGVANNNDGSADVTIASDSNVTFTNTYTRDKGILTIQKRVEGLLSGDSASDVTFMVTITGPADAAGVTFKDANGDDRTFVASGNGASVDNVAVEPGTNVTIAELPTDHYTITEVQPSAATPNSNYEILNGKYYFVEVVDDGKDEVELGTTGATATITNKYAPYYSVTIEKQVGGEMGSGEDWFDFTVSPKENGSLPEGMTITSTDAEVNERIDMDDHTFQLKAGATVTIGHLKANDAIVVTEAASQSGYKTNINTNGCAGASIHENGGTDGVTNIKVPAESANAANLGTVIYTNTRGPVAPTGLESNHTTPYVLMITAAGMAGLALIGGIVARRIRRRRQE